LKCCADNDLEQYYEDLQTAGINVEILLKSGEPEKEILKELKAKKYDLVVMGIHGHSFLGSLIFGSVSRKVRSKSDVPLLLLKIKK
jgi:universal stress protein A